MLYSGPRQNRSDRIQKKEISTKRGATVQRFLTIEVGIGGERFSTRFFGGRGGKARRRRRETRAADVVYDKNNGHCWPLNLCFLIQICVMGVEPT